MEGVAGDPARIICCRGPWSAGRLPHVSPLALLQFRRMKAVGQEFPDHTVVKELHPTVGVMNHKPFGGTEQVVGISPAIESHRRWRVRLRCE